MRWELGTRLFLCTGFLWQEGRTATSRTRSRVRSVEPVTTPAGSASSAAAMTPWYNWAQSCSRG